MGNNIIDLEKLANHKGSAFGSLGEKSQPGQEMFENLLAVELYKTIKKEISERDKQLAEEHREESPYYLRTELKDYTGIYGYYSCVAFPLTSVIAYFIKWKE